MPLIYLDLERSFGGALDHSETRLRHYHQVLDAAIDRVRESGIEFPARATELRIGNAG